MKCKQASSLSSSFLHLRRLEGGGGGVCSFWTFCPTLSLEVDIELKTLKSRGRLSADSKGEGSALTGVQQRGGDINGCLQGHFIQTDAPGDVIFWRLPPPGLRKSNDPFAVPRGFESNAHRILKSLRANTDLQPNVRVLLIPALFCSDVQDLC